MNKSRYQQLQRMSIDDIKKLTPTELANIQNELVNNNLSGWDKEFLPNMAIKFYSPHPKYSQDMIDNFIFKYTGTDTKKFEIDFLDFCKSQNIYLEELNLWKKHFREFIADNRTYDVSWEQQVILNIKFNLPKIPNFPFKIEEW